MNTTDPNADKPDPADFFTMIPKDAQVPQDAFVVKVQDDSAFPFLQPGDLVVCSPAGDELKDGALYFVEQGPDFACRFRWVYTREDGRLDMRPANTNYRHHTIDRQDAGRLALALYVVRSVQSILKNI